MGWLLGLHALPLGAFLSLRATAAAGSTNGGHWRGSSSWASLSQRQLDTSPPPAAASSLGWALWLPGTFFPWGRDTAAASATG